MLVAHNVRVTFMILMPHVAFQTLIPAYDEQTLRSLHIIIIIDSWFEHAFIIHGFINLLTKPLSEFP